MFRIAMSTALVILSTSAFGQNIDEMKGIQFGGGCVGPVSTFAPRLGTCLISDSRSRIWCPNGKIFDRSGEFPQSSYAVRSMCDLDQIAGDLLRIRFQLPAGLACDQSEPTERP